MAHSKRPTWAKTKRVIKPEPDTSGYVLRDLQGLHDAMEAHRLYSGYALAKASGVGPSTVNHLVHGHRRTASARTVGAFREVLGKDLDGVFERRKSTVYADHVSQAA